MSRLPPMPIGPPVMGPPPMGMGPPGMAPPGMGLGPPGMGPPGLGGQNPLMAALMEAMAGGNERGQAQPGMPTGLPEPLPGTIEELLMLLSGPPRGGPPNPSLIQPPMESGAAALGGGPALPY